ncbi:MAG: B12-binding domain-containing radical SAM protein [Gemmatimonadota bacterium]
MRKLRIGVIDLVTKAPNHTLWARVMNANFASIMPQVVSTWCEQQGHEVMLICYTGLEDLEKELPDDIDLVFIGAFSQAAQLAYALSNLFRSKGVVTALGGPHARSYPSDALNYFDYVVGFTDKEVVADLLRDCSPHRPRGRYLSAAGQPAELPGVKERWNFIEPTLKKVPLAKFVPMLGSLGCPYTCEFCVDSVVKYQPLDYDTIKEDLRFLLTKFKRPVVGWHDPNFGVRFDDYMNVIEEAVPPGSIRFLAESSLSLLSEDHLKRLRRNGFKAILPGIESWFGLGNKSKTGKKAGMDKVEQVADHINLVLSYIPYLQANFVFGTDMDEGPEPFECTKRFVDLAPGAYPAYCQLSSFGESAPLNLHYQQADRVLPFPFHFLNTQDSMNVRPLHYEWIEFYEHLIDVTRHTFSARAIYNRYRANRSRGWRWLNVLRGATRQGRGRVELYQGHIDRLRSDREYRDFFEGETTRVPRYYVDKARRELGPFWDWLPEGALFHDHLAYLKAEESRQVQARVAVAQEG